MPLTLLPTNDAEKEDQRDKMNGVKAGRKKEYGINWRYVERQKQQHLEIGLGGEAEAARQERSTAGSAGRTRVRDLVRRGGWNLPKTVGKTVTKATARRSNNKRKLTYCVVGE